MRVLAIDPGPAWSGWATLDVAHSCGVRCTYVASGLAPTGMNPFVMLMREQAVDAVVVEAPAGFAFQPARVPGLLDTSRAAGGMLWVAEMYGKRVVRCTAQQTRKVLAGKANANDAVVRDVVRRNVFGCPAAPSDHVADAIATGVYGAWILVGQVTAPEGRRSAHAGTATKPKRPRARPA